MSGKVVLTGIKPTGMPHLGNYLGAIKPALELAESYDARYFIADYHSLNSIKDPKLLKEYTYEIAACWLACGLDPEKTLIYRQSDVPETFELTTMIMAFTAKGLMNRAHAYKATVDQNREKGRPEDHNINLGLYTYPVLMAADILLFDTNYVPVGKDQVQHIEMAVDIAQAVNRNYKQDLLTLPEAVVSESTQVVVGLDGRKMSKSYDNTIPLFLAEKKLKKLCNKILTNSQTVEEVKDPETCNVFTLYKLFATPEQQDALAARYRAGGMGWGEAKEELFHVINGVLSPMRERYNALMEDTSYIDQVLTGGALKARALASVKIGKLRKAMGFDI
ncbi:tryptophan--tRNA ligase [Oceanispirochaeta sp.]|jgi:tryptophanyl-tRNA synthetase|uniref:tryptophan--tRNA ligase n=1 Tax=Oceanispirochaeta sp. TaxID=2035350 RepID=UPI00260EFA08|nr:tryptophan--tRNA ligase [Oceanispirochaeta sp.]MDA3955193.1 tryptophan--tRNA ligase [Oceanispirochaeta sp.]